MPHQCHLGTDVSLVYMVCLNMLKLDGRRESSSSSSTITTEDKNAQHR
jgi:hypothetical protein